MGENSKIEWTDHTFNGWIGCTKVSPGCLNCYAETLMDKRYNRVNWGRGKPRLMTSDANWRKPLLWNREAQKLGVMQSVFCSSLADVFDQEVPDEWRSQLFALMSLTINLRWLVLTKRPKSAEKWMDYFLPQKNIFLGISAENQERLDERMEIVHKLGVDAFVSAEPLLGALKIAKWEGRISWVIVGGESGSAARPINSEWVNEIRDDCAEYGLPFFFKQWGEFAPGPLGMERVGKHQAGRELGGREWSQTPWKK